MITEVHLAIVRAALTFWDEEMATAPHSTYKHYLHSTDVGTDISSEDVTMARRYFNGVELRFALVEAMTGAFISELPVDPKDELSYQSDRQIPVAVLVPQSEPRLNG